MMRLRQHLQQARSNYEVSANQTGYNQLVSNKTGVITARNIEIDRWLQQGSYLSTGN